MLSNGFLFHYLTQFLLGKSKCTESVLRDSSLFFAQVRLGDGSESGTQLPLEATVLRITLYSAQGGCATSLPAHGTRPAPQRLQRQRHVDRTLLRCLATARCGTPGRLRSRDNFHEETAWLSSSFSNIYIFP